MGAGAGGADGAEQTYAFDEIATWLVTHCSKSAVRDLLRTLGTVGSIITRVVADAEAETDRFENLRRMGSRDQLQRGHKYLTVIVDHDSRVLLGPTRSDIRRAREVLRKLGEQRCARISLVSADAAE